jgi:hypothetical protein
MKGDNYISQFFEIAIVMNFAEVNARQKGRPTRQSDKTPYDVSAWHT